MGFYITCEICGVECKYNLLCHCYVQEIAQNLSVLASSKLLSEQRTEPDPEDPDQQFTIEYIVENKQKQQIKLRAILVNDRLSRLYAVKDD